MIPKVSIIILNWNGIEDTIECLESLKKITYPNYEIIVVDNCSGKNEAEILEEQYYDFIQVIRNDKNYGFAGGNNIAIKQLLGNSNPAYFLLLNNDTVVAPDFLNDMINLASSNTSIGIVGPKTYYYQHPDMLQLVWMKVDKYRGQTIQVGKQEIDHGQYDQPMKVDFIQGSCFLIKRSVIEKIGLLNNSYFAYWEEMDYCARAANAGMDVFYCPQSKIWHKNSVQLKPWYKTLGRSYNGHNLLYIYFTTRNGFWFMKKYATKGQYLSFMVYFFSCRFLLVTCIHLIYHRDIKKIVAFLRGITDGLFYSSSCGKYWTDLTSGKIGNTPPYVDNA
jgi:GT2 family glycosyltransferase